MEPLYEARPGAVGLLSWWVKQEVEVPEDRQEKLRTQAMSLTLQAALTRWAHGYEEHGIGTSVFDGWKTADGAIDASSTLTGSASEAFMVGDPSNPARMDEIASDPSFAGWVDPVLTDAVRGAST